ncbi:MAG: metallophosphatase family protein [Planctomycetales bacterium]
MNHSSSRVACFGGVYNNYLALQAALEDIRSRGVDAIFCLGDLGAFGPHPDRVFPLLEQYQVVCLQGNYDDSVGNGLKDCQCGYTDPRDNFFAQISYDYTLQNTSEQNRAMLRNLAKEIRFELGTSRILMCHGSPRRTNEFLWESTTSTHFLEKTANQYQADWILTTHTGIKWQRALGGQKKLVNVGVLGRPENDGQTNVWYTLISQHASGGLEAEFIPVHYDHHRLVREMSDEGLPSEFGECLETGWWTTCLEVLPAKERKRGRW